ncbi:hypothetical protein JOL79_23820 [Microbispora sp. RL4-1S]|uniref:DUF6571 domain-containing protein n=2 Tax=Microbispora oryzae TaxID=2806554 RepID=A0A940WTQ6_9ACTN|nr:hypothetical protein [Microbispora oryzae]
MSDFIGSLTRGYDVIGQEMDAIRRILTSANLSAAGLNPFGEVLSWLETELPKLRRRQATILSSEQLPGWLPGMAAGLVPLNEGAVLTASETQREGGALAERFAALFPSDYGVPGGKTNDDAFARLVAELNTHRNDADFVAAFFAALGAKGTLGLAEKLRTGMNDPEKALDVVSRAFGTAVREGADVPGFAAVRYELVTGKAPPSYWSPLVKTAAGPQPPGHAGFEELRAGQPAVPAEGERRLGDLLRAGEFPADWLAAVVSMHALGKKSTVNGTDLAGFLNALGNNARAARTAISAAAKEYGSLPKALSALNKRVEVWGTYARQPDMQEKEDSRADAFGRMLAAASGAYDEKDGAHSAEAAQLAFQFMRELPKLDIQAPTRVHLAEIAGSYATEITEGANLGDANRTLPSAFGPVQTIIPGLKPAFRLSPKETYAFVKTFADSPEHIAPFEEGMGNLTDRIVNAAAKKDHGAGVDNLERAMRSLGYVAGMQFMAERERQEKLDAEDQQRIKRTMFMYGLGLGVIGLFIPGMKGQVLWLGISTATPPEVESLLTPDKTRVEALEEKDRAAALARETWLVNTLMSNGFKARVPPNDARFANPPITGSDGRLLPFYEIAKSREAVINFNEWLVANGSGGTDETQIGEAQTALKIAFDGPRRAVEDAGSLVYK